MWNVMRIWNGPAYLTNDCEIIENMIVLYSSNQGENCDKLTLFVYEMVRHYLPSNDQKYPKLFKIKSNMESNERMGDYIAGQL